MDFSLDFNQFFEVKFIDSVYCELPLLLQNQSKDKNLPISEFEQDLDFKLLF